MSGAVDFPHLFFYFVYSLANPICVNLNIFIIIVCSENNCFDIKISTFPIDTYTYTLSQLSVLGIYCIFLFRPKTTCINNKHKIKITNWLTLTKKIIVFIEWKVTNDILTSLQNERRRRQSMIDARHIYFVEPDSASRRQAPFFLMLTSRRRKNEVQ